MKRYLGLLLLGLLALTACSDDTQAPPLDQRTSDGAKVATDGTQADRIGPVVWLDGAPQPDTKAWSCTPGEANMCDGFKTQYCNNGVCTACPGFATDCDRKGDCECTGVCDGTKCKAP